MSRRRCYTCDQVYDTDDPEGATCPECGSFVSQPYIGEA